LLIGYGPRLRELGQQAAGYVERIFNGAQPGELPFQGPTRLDFAINMRTAKALGLTIPPSLLVGADEVIDRGRRNVFCWHLASFRWDAEFGPQSAHIGTS